MSFSSDIRHALRGWRSSPGFTLVSLATLAIGIGATTAIWSVVYGVLLRPFPFPEADRVIMAGHSYRSGEFEASISAASYLYLKEHQRAFERIAVVTDWQPSAMLGAEPERLEGARVTSAYFATLGLRPVTGRDFQTGEDEAGRNNVVILGEGLWTRSFGRDPSAVGRTLLADGESLEIVGVMPQGLEAGGIEPEIYRPVAFTEEQKDRNQWGWEWLALIGRIKPEVTREGVRADLDRVGALARAELNRDWLKTWGYWWRTVPDQLHRGVRPALMILLGAVALVLLIACANLTNLLLVRAVARGREIAVRIALGARRRQLLRQLLTESVLLSVAGGVLGLGLAWGGVTLMLGLMPTDLPYAARIGLNPAVLLVTAAVSIGVGVVTGLAPMWHAFRTDSTEMLKEGTRGAAGWGRLRPTLAAGQLALSMMLVIGAGLLGRTVLRLLAVDPGFTPEGVMTFQVALPRAVYPTDDAQAQFLDNLRRRLAEIPGVTAAGTAAGMPLTRQGWTASFEVVGYTPPSPDQSPWGDQLSVSPGFFEAMGMTLVEGRFFGEQDRRGSPPVVIVDEVLAKRYWPGESALGQQIGWGGDGPKSVVGVVKHVIRQGPVDPGRTQLYHVAGQVPGPMQAVAIRGRGNPAALTGPAREALRAVDPQVAMFDVRPMTDRLGDLAAQPRFLALLVGAFAVIALALAAIGIYGVLAYAVAQRTREMGIRMALGADRARVLRLVLGDGLRLGGLGLGLGLVGAFAGTRLLASQLYGAPAVQPAIFGAALFACAGALLLASWLPAWRATGVDPVEALRSE